MRNLRVVTLFSAVLSLPCWADPTLTPEQLKLTGIAAYQVVVQRLPPAATQCGISQEQLKTQVELALRKHGIPVKSTAWDHVDVRLTILFDAQVHGCFYSLSVHIDGLVRRHLGQLKTQVIGATLWEKEGVGLAPSQEAPQHVKELLADLLDAFCNDHLAANPRGSARK